MSEERSLIIEQAIRIEAFISVLLASELGIDHKTSKAFNDGAFSFNLKIKLLADMNIVKRTDKGKFEAFAQVRNKFAHVLDVASYTECMNAIGTTKNYLMKLYAQPDEVETEDLFGEIFLRLFNDIKGIIKNIISASAHLSMDKIESGRQALIHLGVHKAFMKLAIDDDIFRENYNRILVEVEEEYHKDKFRLEE